MKKRLLLAACCLLNISFAQIAINKTRVIIDRDVSATEVLVLENKSSSAPYLAQSWIEDQSGNKIKSGLVVLPILQRLDAGKSSQVKVDAVGNMDFLPQDRETLLYFNVLGVPPKNDTGTNRADIVIQSQIKLFYRPKGLQKYGVHNGWVNDLKVSRAGNSITFENPTPYNTIFFGYTGRNGKMIREEMIIKPFSSISRQLSLGNSPSFHFINDFGSSQKVTFQCPSSGQCTLK